MRLSVPPAVARIPKLWQLATMLSRTVIAIVPDVLTADTQTELFSILVLLMTTAAVPPAVCTTIPPPVCGAMPLVVMVLLLTKRAEFPAFGENLISAAEPPLKPEMITLSTSCERPLPKFIPIWSFIDLLIERLRRITSMPDAVTVIPFEPAARIPPVNPQSMVIDLVMVTAPKPPGSLQLISPAGAVFEMAPAKVLHGAVRLHGLTSSPTPETHVRVACARAGSAFAVSRHAAPSRAINEVLMTYPLMLQVGCI